MAEGVAPAHGRGGGGVHAPPQAPHAREGGGTAHHLRLFGGGGGSVGRALTTATDCGRAPSLSGEGGG